MSASEIVTGVFAALIGLGGLVMLPRVWGGYLRRQDTLLRGRLRSHGELTFIWWPLGDATRRGLMRGVVPMTFAICGAVIGYWVMDLAAGQGPDRYHSRPARLTAAITAAWFGIGWVLLLTIMFFNRPTLLVPPEQRDKPGAIAEWRSVRQREQHR
jgi:hypothetical protein